jgi:hypothetical protein
VSISIHILEYCFEKGIEKPLPRERFYRVQT